MNSRRNTPVATAIHLRWWGMRALSKAHELFYQLRWSAAERATNKAFEMVAPLASLNLHRNSIALAEAPSTSYRFA